ncbi:MAG: NAD-dependent dehydratase [Saprospiraceae bacterium]|nr:MAG: NAD-dependent dehydratase [Saprospiraceae bacterium]
MEKILITGASGFVGSHLVEEALGRNLEVYAGVRKTSSKAYLQDPRIRFFENDFENFERLAEQLEAHRFEYIIHNAGLVNAARPEDFWKVNFEYVRTFTRALEKCPPRKFTFVSSLAAYGPASNENLDDFLYEDREPKPINTYGKSKLAAERHIKSIGDFPWIIMRPGGVYGPRDQDFYTFFKLLDKGLEAYIGTRPQHLAFIYVKDLARVMLDATLADVVQRAYFVSDGKHYTQWDLGTLAKRILGKRTVRIHVPLWLVRSVAWTMEKINFGQGRHPALNLEKVRILESLNWKCDIQPLVRDFGFKPAWTLEEGLRETIAWYKGAGWL